MNCCVPSEHEETVLSHDSDKQALGVHGELQLVPDVLVYLISRNFGITVFLACERNCSFSKRRGKKFV